MERKYTKRRPPVTSLLLFSIFTHIETTWKITPPPTSLYFFLSFFLSCCCRANKVTMFLKEAARLSSVQQFAEAPAAVVRLVSAPLPRLLRFILFVFALFFCCCCVFEWRLARGWGGLGEVCVWLGGVGGGQSEWGVVWLLLSRHTPLFLYSFKGKKNSTFNRRGRGGRRAMQQEAESVSRNLFFFPLCSSLWQAVCCFFICSALKELQHLYLCEHWFAL